MTKTANPPAEKKPPKAPRLPKPPVEIPHSGKQLLDIKRTCAFLCMDRESLRTIRNDPDERFPQPLQILRDKPMWPLEELERYVERKQREVQSLNRR